MATAPDKRVPVPADLHRRVMRIAKLRNTSIASFVERAIEAALSQKEGTDGPH